MFSLHYTGMEGIVNHEMGTVNDMERGLETEDLDLAFTSGGKHAMISIRLKRQKAVGSMDYLSHNIGVNLKRIRKSKGMSLDIVAEQTGVSKSMLAQIEKGNANPSIGVLGKIVSGLRLEFNDLIETPPLDSFMVRVSETIPTKEMLGKYKVWTCFPIEDNHMVEIYRIDIEPDGVYTSGSHGEKTREYIAVMEGELTVSLKDGLHTITRDDVFRFESDQDHKYMNLTKSRLSFMTFFVAY